MKACLNGKFKLVYVTKQASLSLIWSQDTKTCLHIIFRLTSIHVLISALYSKCSKVSNTSCLVKRSRQTVQTQTSLLFQLLLKKQSDQGLPCLLFWQAFSDLVTLVKLFIFNKSNSSILLLKQMHYVHEKTTVWILISWLHHCFLKRVLNLKKSNVHGVLISLNIAVHLIQ